jgi:hypothetical protein
VAVEFEYAWLAGTNAGGMLYVDRVSEDCCSDETSGDGCCTSSSNEKLVKGSHWKK